MIKKLFGGKSDGFFLELDESENSQPTETKVEEKQPEPTAVATEEKPPEPAATQEPEKQPEPAAVATEEKPPEAPEAAEAKSAKKSKKTSIKNRKKTATKTAATPSPKTTPVSSGSKYEPPFWVKAMYNSSSSNGSNGQVEGGQQTFATDNLLPTPSASRRRPGPSLNKFKEMARQAKIRRR